MMSTIKLEEGRGMFRKMIFATVALVAAAVSCRKAETVGSGVLRVTATIEKAVSSRVSYEVEETSVKPSWDMNDEIFGYDSNGGTFTFTVTGIGETGSAIIDSGAYSPKTGTTLYAVYCPGKSAGDMEDGEIRVDLFSQTGVLDSSSPLIMCATGTVVDGGNGPEVSLKFHNQMAIVGVKQFKVKPGDAITCLTLNGVQPKGAIKRGASGFGFVPDEGAAQTVITFRHPLKADGSGLVDEPQYFIVAPQSEAEILLYAKGSSEMYVNLTDISTFDIVAGNYYYMSKKMGANVEIPELGMVFPSVAKAISAAEKSISACTIKLLADCAEDTLTLNCPAKTTIDLNGHTLLTSITISGKAEICDSSDGNGQMGLPTSKSPDEDIYGRNIFLSAGSELTINGGTFTGRTTSPSSYNHIQIINCNGTSSNRVKLTINKGNFIGKSQAGVVLVTQADVIVNDGDFNSSGTYGRNFRIRAGGKITLKGGTYYSDKTNVIQYSSDADANSSVTVTGGNLSSNGALFNFGSSDKVKLTISGGNMATPSGVDIFGGSKVSVATKTIKGGRYSADCSSAAAAASGYKWQKMASSDTKTIPGYTLAYEVVKN